MKAKTQTPNQVQPIPQDYGSLTPYVIVRGAEQFLAFLRDAFGAQERGRAYNEDGTIGHAEVWISDSVLMLFDGKETWPPTPAFLTLYVEDCDAMLARAVAAGATVITELSNNAWGDRGGRIRDPFGNIWWLQTHVEDVPEDEIERRMGQQVYRDDLQYAQETLARELLRRAPPAGYHTVNPFIIPKGATAFIQFVETVFESLEAQEIKEARTPDDDGLLIHAEVQIGDSVIMIFDSKDDWPPTPGFLQVYVDDVEAVLQRAQQHGATVVTEVSDFVYGEKVARFQDPWGNLWWINQRVAEVDWEAEAKRVETELEESARQQEMGYLKTTLLHALRNIYTRNYGQTIWEP